MALPKQFMSKSPFLRWVFFLCADTILTSSPSFHFPNTQFSKTDCLFPSHYSRSFRMTVRKLWAALWPIPVARNHKPCLCGHLRILDLTSGPDSMWKELVPKENWGPLTEGKEVDLGRQGQERFIFKVLWTFILALCLHPYVYPKLFPLFLIASIYRMSLGIFSTLSLVQ